MNNLETGLLAGLTLIASATSPSAPVFKGEVSVYKPLEKNQTPNLKNLNPVLMEKLEAYDPGNQYAVPYEPWVLVTTLIK